MSTATALPPVGTPTVVAQEEPLYEVVNGQRMELPPTSAYVTWIANLLTGYLRPVAVAGQRGTVVMEMLFVLDTINDLRRRPDVAFVSAQKWPLDRPLPETGDWEVVPDLAVEVNSPNDLFKDVVAKVMEYFRLGVRQVWLVVPSEKQVYVYDSPSQVRILTETDELDRFANRWRIPVRPTRQRGPALAGASGERGRATRPAAKCGAEEGRLISPPPQSPA